MLDEQGNINFATEFLDAIEAFMKEYEAREGALDSELERGLVVSYVLGVMRCDLEAIWDQLAKAAIFGALHPRAVFEQCTCDGPIAEHRRASIREELAKRGWVSLEVDSN